MGKNGFLVKASETNCSKSQLEKEYKNKWMSYIISHYSYKTKIHKSTDKNHAELGTGVKLKTCAIRSNHPI